MEVRCPLASNYSLLATRYSLSAPTSCGPVRHRAGSACGRNRPYWPSIPRRARSRSNRDCSRHFAHRSRPGRDSVDRRVDETLEVERSLLVGHRLPGEAKLDDIGLLDQLGRERARDEEVLRIIWMAYADMAIGVDHVLLGEDPVGDDEILDKSVETGHGSLIQRKRERDEG